MRVFPTLLSRRFEKIIKHITIFVVAILGIILDPIFPCGLPYSALWAALFCINLTL